MVLSQISILGQNPKIGYQKFNDLQTPKLSKKHICDRTLSIGKNGLVEGIGFLDMVRTPELMVALQDGLHGIIEDIRGCADIATTQEPPINPERSQQVRIQALV
jgi:hypothetical protein